MTEQCSESTDVTALRDDDCITEYTNVSYQHVSSPIRLEQQDNVDSSHPFFFIEDDGKSGKSAQWILEATQNGARIRVSRSVGRLALSLGIGREHRKTREEITRDLHHDESAPRIVSSSTLNKQLRTLGEHIRDHDLALSISAEWGRTSSETTYYYEGVRPEHRDEDFADWDKAATSIRLDKETGYLIVAKDGLRTGAPIQGDIRIQVLEYLLRHRNEAVSAPALQECLIEQGDDKVYKKSSYSHISSLRKYLHRRLGQDPDGWLEYTSLNSGDLGFEDKPDVRGFYTLRADRVEIIEEDGSLSVVNEASEAEVEEPPLGPVEVRDMALLALGVSLKRHHLKKLPIVPSIALPDSQDLMAIVEGRLPDDYGARQLVADNIIECSQRMMDFFDSDNAQEVFQDWSPDDGKLKSFVSFLAQFDSVAFTLNGERIRGLEFIRRINSTA